MSAKQITRQIRRVKLSSDLSKVQVTFIDVNDLEPMEGEEESSAVDTEYKAKSKFRPHKDLVRAFKKLNKHAKAILGLPDDLKDSLLTVIGMKIAGDLLLKQCRVTMTVALHVELTGKVIEFDIPQITIYGDTLYTDAAAMAKCVETITDESWEYLKGKHDGFEELEEKNQLAFSFEAVEA